MKSNNPLVSVLIAAYKPNKEWFTEQLTSINKQTYPHIEVLIWDDCPESSVDQTLVQSCITRFEYTLIRSKKNLGSNLAFEELTKKAGGMYFAYCDQDDIWCEHKIETLVRTIQKTDSALVCSDAYIINENGKKIANSVKKVFKRHVFYEGDNVAQRLIFSNFVMGCATLVCATTAQQALPFEKSFVHDHWLGIFAATTGKITLLKEPLLFYRRHGNNQTGILMGVTDKKSYYKIRLLDQSKRMSALAQRLKDIAELKTFFTEYCAWLDAKEYYYRKPNIPDLRTMWKYKYFGKHQVYLESVMPFIPNAVFKIIINLSQKGIL